MLLIDVEAVGDVARTLERAVPRFGVGQPRPELGAAPSGLDAALGDLVAAYQHNGAVLAEAVQAFARHLEVSVLAVRSADRFFLGGGA